MKTTYISAILLAATFTCFSQPDLDGRYELGGSLGYSYSSMDMFGSEYTIQTFSLHPRIGFFLTPALEICLGPSVSLAFTRIGAGISLIGGVPFFTPEYETESYNLGLTPVVTYHFLVDDAVVPYLALSASLFWQRSISKSPFSVGPTRWTKPTIIAPTVDAGVRIFLSQDWALQIGLIYSKTLQHMRDTQSDGYSLSFGTGFAIFL